MSAQIKKSIRENQVDLESLYKQKIGILPTVLNQFQLDTLIETKRDNIKRLEKHLKKGKR